MNMDTMLTALFGLEGKVALITGASRGIGLATAKLFCAAGAKVVLSSNEPAACEEQAAILRAQGGEAEGIGCDVSREAELDRLVAETGKRCGAIDVLVCNAGAAPHFGAISSASDADYELTLTVNLRHSLWLTNRVAGSMAARGEGSIILMSSIAALRGADKIGLYALAKAAIAQLARNLALEWGPSNVRVNAISPGLIRTHFASGILDDPVVLKKRLAATPLRRLGEPDEVAALALYLASPASAFVTGQNHVIDGGLVVHNGN